MKRWVVRTYTSDTGKKPVDEWLGSIDPAARAEMIAKIDLLETWGTALEMPHARPVQDGIWELRAKGRDTIERVLYFHWFDRTFGLLHGFTKKSRSTPRADIDVAKKRRDVWRSRPGPNGRKG